MNFLTNIILPFRNESLNHFFLIFTKLGNWETIIFLCVCVVSLFYFFKKNSFILPLMVTVLGSGVTAVIIKYLINSPRPGDGVSLYLENSPSFPSTHSTLILAFFGFLIYCIWKFNWKKYTKIIITIIFGIIIILIGFSRLYLGVHYLSDVLAGYLAAFLWILISINIFKKVYQPK